MAPNTQSNQMILHDVEDNIDKLIAPQASPRVYEIVYLNFLTFGYWHIAAIYGIYLSFTSAKLATILFGFILFVIAEIGITAGAHRLWAHKTYKAKLPLQIILMVFNSIAFQNTATDWVRDHRLHHKYSDTDADPHNATRGFFYSHVGWLLVRKHPEVKKRGRLIDMSDINNNFVLRFQKKYAVPFIGTVCFILPTLIPMYVWGESLNNAWHVTLLRYVFNLNVTFLVNSAAHIWGNKPYDKRIASAQNAAVSMATFGEGFHNYHHVFPWDYRAAELGNNNLNLTTKFIDFFAWIGWAYDLKTVPDEIIRARAGRTGDGTFFGVGGNKQVKVALTKYTGKQLKLGELRHHVLIVKLYDKWLLQYRAICAGSIITTEKVLTSANCFLTNRKRRKHKFDEIRVVAGILHTIVQEPIEHDIQQWRSISHLYSQSYYRFPAYDLAIVETFAPFIYNQFVKNIPYASKDQDFDGVCTSTSLKPTQSWSERKFVFVEQLQLLKRRQCERKLLRSCRLYICTQYNKMNAFAFVETTGSGLICHGTGDPKEENEKEGILVGVTSLINVELPSLYTRVGLFHKWITDNCWGLCYDNLMLLLCFIVIILLN